MRKTVKLLVEFDSLDVEVLTKSQVLLEDWVPEDQDNVTIQVTMHIGMENDARRDIFETIVSTEPIRPMMWAKSLISKVEPVVIERYEWPIVEKKLRDMVNNAACDNWFDTRQKLRKIFYWEYEGMDESSPI